MLHQQTHQNKVGFCFILYGILHNFSSPKTEHVSGLTAILTAIKSLCNALGKITWNLRGFCLHSKQFSCRLTGEQNLLTEEQNPLLKEQKSPCFRYPTRTGEHENKKNTGRRPRRSAFEYSVISKLGDLVS